MISRRDWEPLPTPTLSPFALARPGTFLRVGFFTAAVWCVPALRVLLVHSLINHFRQKGLHINFTHKKRSCGLRSTGGPELLKWGLPGGGVKSAKAAPTSHVYYPPRTEVGTRKERFIDFVFSGDPPRSARRDRPE